MSTVGRMALGLAAILLIANSLAAGDDPRLGQYSYDQFEPAKTCGVCHRDLARQHEQALMSQAYTHAWDQIEYFKLALPHASKDAKVAGVKAGCNGCHAPLAYLAGEIPPKPAEAESRANEGVSCDVCHTITGFSGDTPYNFNWTIDPKGPKQGPRADAKSPHHATAQSEFLHTAEFCGTCHNEKSPYDTWVKATHLEWKESPQAKAGIRCQDCHMASAPGRSVATAGERPDIRQHLFHGAHDVGKLHGAAEVRIHPDSRRVGPGNSIRLTAIVFNGKAGHMIPTGSAEERVVWLEVLATDAKGTVYRLPVDRKNFEGEDFTIASDSAMAYQDIGEIRDIENFAGLRRDGDVPAGSRIFRLPYLDPKGRMTISQWNTASFGPDYRLAPLKAVRETYTWKIPPEIPAGDVTVTAKIYYSRLVSSVAEFLDVPPDEWKPVEMNSHTTNLTVVR